MKDITDLKNRKKKKEIRSREKIVSSLHVLNIHIQYVHYTYTYSKTLHGGAPTCNSC